MNWETLKDIVAGAMELPADQRSAFLDRSCAGDPELRRESEALLDCDTAGPFLDLDQQPDMPAAPVRIGSYRIDREIGEGGMGVVYLGIRDDGQFEQRVAIKLIKLGMDSGAILRRFLAERRILSRLVHPNITRILDGGIALDGRPYFVMEQIDGLPIDEYCRKLDPSAIIRIFLQVCDAVGFAHGNLILHRDLKSSNILVDSGGVPHLLDFGIAKLLDDDSPVEHTATALRILTPRAASPEQIKGEPLTTASDVYSLGALLYELLAQQPPYDLSGLSPAEASDALCHRTPPRPSEIAPAGVRKRLAGDLDNIILRALEKEPNRRYQSAADLAADLRRHLDGLPVLARPTSFAYRTRKLIYRNRAQFAVAALLLVAIAGGVITTTIQARRADRRFTELRALAHSVIFELDDAIAKIPGTTEARAILVQRALNYLDGLARETGTDRSLLLEVAAGYERLGTVQGDRTVAHLLDLDGSERSLNLSRDFYRRVLAKSPGDLEASRGLASVEGKMSRVELGRGRVTEGKQQAVASLALYRDIANKTGTREDHAKVASGLGDLGYAQLQANDLPGALKTYNEEAVLREEWVRIHPQDEAAQSALAAFYRRLAQVQARQRMIREALQSFAKARAIDEAIVARHPGDLKAKTQLAADLDGPARMAMRLGNFPQAAAILQRARDIYEEAVAADPTNERPRHSLMLVSSMLGQALAASHNVPAAMAAARRSLEIARDVDHNHHSANTQASVADGEIAMGDVLAAAGKPAEAVGAYHRAEKLYIDLKSRNELNIDQVKAFEELNQKLASHE